MEKSVGYDHQPPCPGRFQLVFDGPQKGVGEEAQIRVGDVVPVAVGERAAVPCGGERDRGALGQGPQKPGLRRFRRRRPVAADGGLADGDPAGMGLVGRVLTGPGLVGRHGARHRRADGGEVDFMVPPCATGGDHPDVDGGGTAGHAGAGGPEQAVDQSDRVVPDGLLGQLRCRPCSRRRR